MMAINTKRIAELLEGDIVWEHGGLFLVESNAMESASHRPMDAHLVQAHGPSDCAVARSVCIEGCVPGYFSPGSSWTFQGATWVRVYVIN